MSKKDVIYIAIILVVLLTKVQANATEQTTTTTEYVAPTTTEILTTTVECEYVPEYKELGTYKLTAYCACSKCCGKNDGITASGVKAQADRTIAAGKQFPFGTELMIDGEIYVVEDRGGFGSNTIDIYMDSHSDALNFGVKYAKVYEVKK